ncbi:MarR family transcriptional regulator [uncultured Roseovarius sp.]|uniref:MarR family transcriptional regulator n=1 Tax=uncultured Roseovarius sp. TaxID=293344 RepID=UPI002620D2E4|nr:MarR family transcriptional regulator [uncultured Roseovarius sp.]
MQHSLTLDLFHAARGYQDRVTRHLAHALRTGHGITLSPAQLSFLSILICGENTASGVARRAGVSRQAAQRQATALAQEGYLALAQDPAKRNQSLITFTTAGETLMALCREILAGWDADLMPEAETLRRAALIMNHALPE